MGILWKSYWNFIGILWEFYGNLMEFLWDFYGIFYGIFIEQMIQVNIAKCVQI